MRPVSTDNYLLEPAHVKAGFQKAAKTYHRASSVQQEVARRLVERLSCFKIAPSTVLDAGCGTGFLLPQLQKQYPEAKIVGVDFSLPMLKENPLAAHTPKIAQIAGDLQQLPFADNSFNLIVCNCVLHWCTHIRQVLQEFARVLAPEGFLLFSTMGPDTLYELRASWEAIDTTPHVHSFLDLHLLGDCLVESGLRDPVMSMQKITFTYETLQTLFLDLRQSGAGNKLQARQKSLCSKQAVKRLQQQYTRFQTPEGLFPATYELVYGHAVGAPSSELLDTEDSLPITKQERRVLL